MNFEAFRKIEPNVFYALLGLFGLIAAAGMGAAYYMEVHGHVVTGMTNQVVWGMPHVFAIFLIVAASGVLNLASLGSVFGNRCTRHAHCCPACWPSPCWQAA